MHRCVAVDTFSTSANICESTMRCCAYASEIVIEIRLPVASDTGGTLARDKHFIAYRTVRIVTKLASFAHGVMFEHERAPLFFVALKAFFILTLQYLTARRVNVMAVHAVTIAARHMPFDYRMVVL